MKRVTAFVGSARKQHTDQSTRQFLAHLAARGDVEFEVVRLSEWNVETCRGCLNCFEKGEEFCPYARDDRDLLIEKMMASDGVVFASPTYSFQVSAIMKKFLDRLGFAFHRPRFFGKTFTSIVVQGIRGGADVVKYLDMIGNNLGFNVVRGCCLTTCDPITDEARKTHDEVLSALSRRFHARLTSSPYPDPTLFNLMFFRMARTSIRIMLDDTSRDHRYFRDKGWFESDFFFPVRLNPVKRAAGRLFDFAAAKRARRGIVGVVG